MSSESTLNNGKDKPDKLNKDLNLTTNNHMSISDNQVIHSHIHNTEDLKNLTYKFE